ncbi:Ribosomal protein L34Ae [Quillaja saponaria]|uniref:Ribosomal protein L34Ae n=1 Tax=Quillaja saponaria TaxID=32244 RepID=A0AAD7Q3Y5_QUISA|nr:Ribosomal protein L34Ae [Quillaja saponaria]
MAYSNYTSIKDGNFNGFEGCSSSFTHGCQVKPEPEVDYSETINSTRNVGFEEETTKFVFRFKFRTYEEFCRSYRENCCSVDSAKASTSTSNYEFFPGKNYIAVKELYLGPDQGPLGNRTELVQAEFPQNPTDRVCKEQRDNYNIMYDFIGLSSESDSSSSNLESSSISQLGSSTDGILSDKDFDCLENGTKPNSQNVSACDSEESNGLETQWEHQDLIEQLKMELKRVKATGLPTILEESEFPKITDDLKPWKIDEKFQHGNRTKELPKFYKSYRERMRKFDIMNYQKMYAIGFLQSHPLQSLSSRKSSASAMTFLFSHLYRRKRSETDPMKKFNKVLYSDLEMVYVGQLCLSWEFLHWQYEKALELWESDPCGLKRYNEVAGEFQQFQVLMQRFIENEPFQDPRVENYVKNRCTMGNLLQVPLIREDNQKDKNRLRRGGKDENAITSDKLVEILEESIRIIWHFIRADKDANNLMTLKSLKETQAELQDPATDEELLAEIRADLQKKEKRLKDILRSGNCILKKFQKHQEDGTDHFLYFFCQVDMKLVYRVLNMSRITTEQLGWCRSKLNNISFVNRRIHVEPSFLLFPCS